METEPLAWIGETASTELEDEMVAKYEAQKIEAEYRALRNQWLWRFAGLLGLLGFLLLCWAIGRMTPG